MSTGSFLFALLTALLWGLAPVLDKFGLKGNLNPLTGVIARSLAVSVAAFLVLIFLKRGPELLQANIRDIAFIVAGGLLASFLGQWTYYAALKQGQSSSIVPIVAIYPLVTLIFSVLFLYEVLTWQKVLGVMFVVAGVVLIK